MAVYYPSNVNCYQQEPIYLLNHLHHQQQQPSSSSSSAAAASFVGGENARNEMVFIPPTTTTIGGGDVEVVTALPQNLNGDDVPVSSSELTFRDGRGLSLSLSTQILDYHHQYQPGLSLTPNPSIPVIKETPPFSREMLLLGQSDPSSSGFAGFYNGYRYNETSSGGGFMNMSSVLRSRYLKPAQSLLDEVVSVKKEINHIRKKKKGEDFNNDSNGIPIELSTTERQELQSKKNKLLTLVDEVDKRYNQYYHQMEALASSFEIVAGFGSARPYTSVALNRISSHFRSLRDAMKEQIQMMGEKLGEKGGELSLDEQREGERIPRLRYLDQRLRQQRALHQQFGMVRPSWRPQRGLPESSVSALRAWLFEHFLHPYPKESEKVMLAKQTGLSKNQVANWFINARVRLWKPMIEEMYKEEFGDASELLIPKSSQGPHITTNQEDSSSQQENKNNNLTYSSAEPKPNRTSGNEDDPPQQQQTNRSADYDTLMNYHGFGLDDYQQDSRFSNGHHLHDFAV